MTPVIEHEPIVQTTPSPAPAGVVVDPTEHPGWDGLLTPHREAFVFHGAGWARVLKETYRQVPYYLSQFNGPRLNALLPVMEVSSVWKGRRGVALPFTDFCPALGGEAEKASLYDEAIKMGRSRGWKYLECRGGGSGWAGATPSLSFYGHSIDLSGGAETIFKRFESSVRRGIRKAESGGLESEFSTSPEAVKIYYALHCQTRRRHGLPPQPFRFFENIQRHMLEKGEGFVAIVRSKGQPLAAGVFFYKGHQALYKFGASDFAFQQLRPNNLMMWAGMRHCAEKGCLTLHLGRTSLGNEGLRRFKLGLGAVEENVQYCKYDFSANRFVTEVDGVEGWFNRVFERLPLPLLRLAGRILYPHLS